MDSRRLARAALLGGFVLAPLSAGATIMVPLSLEDMAKESAAVVRARVVDQAAGWDEKKEHIYTTTQLEVLDTIHARSRLPGRIQVRSLGGEVGDIGMRVAGTPSFAPGEEVVVFLRADPKGGGAFQVIGMSQGKFRVVREAKGRLVAVPSLEGLALARQGEDGRLRVDHASPDPEHIPLEELRRRVDAALRSTVQDGPMSAPPETPVSPAPLTPAPAVHR